jgi:AAA domain
MRNPMGRNFWRNLDETCKKSNLSTTVVPNSAHSTPLGFTIIGFPGVGKSTSVEAVLSLYPQVIYHNRYRDRELNVAQLVWLKLECPHDGSIKGLCLNFFQTVDDLLGTNYAKNYAGSRRTTDELLPPMARLAALHGVGVLVIDEINRLSGTKSGGAARMLNFFVQLTNSIGVPAVLVGTFKAKSVLSGEFHQIRRGTGQGDLVWDRMEKGGWVDDNEHGDIAETQKPGVWQLLLESLWTYQYVNVPCPLTKELSDALYEETQGITDFACKVYMLAQVRAIVTARTPQDEVVTPDIIRSVARDSLRQAQPVLMALRRGDDQYLSSVPDINPISVDEFIREAQSEFPKKQEPVALDNRRTDPPTCHASYGELPRPQPNKKRVYSKRPSKKASKNFVKDDLRTAVAKPVGPSTPAFETLENAGHIASATEYLDQQEATV